VIGEMAALRWEPTHVTKHTSSVIPLQCLGGAPSYYCSLAMFGNLEVFFVSLSLLSLCFVIIIKYSRAQKGTQVSYPHPLPFLLL